MGNLKISKTKKKKNTKGTSGMPNWLLSLIISVVLIAVVATCVFYFITSAGLQMRWTTAVELDGYKVNVNMMSYYQKMTYENFINQQYETFGYYASYMGEDATFDDYLEQYVGYNRELDPASQSYTADDESGDTYKTWHDYFVAQTVESVKELLMYRAEAEKLGIELDKEEIESINADIDAWIEEFRASQGGYPEKDIVSMYYGKSVRRTDIVDAMKLSVLASKCSNKISTDIEESITDEDVTKEYDENKNNYNFVDYASYNFEVSYADVISEELGADKKADDLTDEEKAKVLAAYKAKIEEARAKAAELASKTELKDFQSFIINDAATSEYDGLADSKIATLASDKKPSEEDLKTIKDKTISAVIAEVTEGKDTVTDDVVETSSEAKEGEEATKTYTIYGISITSEFATAIRDVKSSLFDRALTESTVSEKATYVAPYEDEDGNEEKDTRSEWLFNADRKANEITTLEEGDGANGAEVAVSTEKFTAEVLYITKTAYRDETSCRDVAYIIYATEDAAKKAIEAIGKIEDLNKDKFLEVANDESNLAAGSDFAEEYCIGESGETNLDAWLTDAEVGSYTEEPILMSDGSAYMVAFYASEGEMKAWQYTVKSTLHSNRYTDRTEEMQEAYASHIIVYDKALAKIESTYY